MKQEKLRIEDAAGIIVARGPGSYNGLRVGLATAKGLAFSLGVPVVGIGTLEAEAYQAASGGAGLPVCAISNAGRGEIGAAIFEGRGGEWKKVIGEHVTTVEALCSSIDRMTLFCGEFLPRVAAGISARLGEKAVFATGAAALRRAGFLAELGMRRLEAGDYDDPATLQPLYLRGPAITQPREPFKKVDLKA